MCTMISHQARRFRRQFHALNIDFVNEAAGPGARVAVELTPESARELAHKILATLDQAEGEGWLHAHGEAHGHG